ncbi:MAG: ribose 5-phosphate isomerase A [Candidatus Nezhaarchaeales archaeon]
MSTPISKKRAALEALKHVKSGMVVGLGTGSTSAFFIEALGEAIKRGELSVKGVPTSYQAFQKAVKCGVPIITIEEASCIDLAVDGADEVEVGTLNLIKGRGAALTREKIVDSMAKEFIVIVDDRKIVNKLGVKTPIPVEVLPFGYAYVLKKLKELGCEPTLRSAGTYKDGPLITDNGNFIIDAKFNGIENPRELELTIKSIPGVIEVGIFTGLVKLVYVGYEDRVITLTPQTRKG